MLAELFPFCFNYLYYIIIGVISLLSIDFIFRRKQLSENIVNNDKVIDHSVELSDDDNENNEDDEPALPKDLEHIPFVYTKLDVETIKSRAREFYRISNSRRSIRFFRPDPIPKSIIQDIIRAAGK